MDACTVKTLLSNFIKKVSIYMPLETDVKRVCLPSSFIETGALSNSLKRKFCVEKISKRLLQVIRGEVYDWVEWH